jgi:hypothetical protein
MPRTTLLAALAVALAGCGGDPPRMADRVKVHGTVTLADGKPIRDVMLTLQPTQTGHLAGFKVGADGRFSGEAIPGKYAFSLQPREGADRTKSLAALKQVPEKYRAPQLDHQVTIPSGGGAVEIKLD